MTSAKDSSSDQEKPEDSATTGLVNTTVGMLGDIANSAEGQMKALVDKMPKALMEKMPSGLSLDLKGTASAIASPDNYVELKDRMAAWWNGDGGDVKDTAEKDTAEKGDSEKQVIVKSVEKLPDLNEWTPERFRVVQELWGEGFMEPGGRTFARKLISAAKIDSKQTVLDLSLKLGGTTMLVAKDASLFMEAWDARPEVAKKANSIINSLGLGKRISVETKNCNDADFAENKYDLIYSREKFFTIENKKLMLEKIGQSLKAKGQLLFTDLMVCDPDANAGKIAVWSAAERETPYPWTEELYKTSLKQLGFTIWASNDFTKEYLEFINAGWHKIMVKIEDGDFNRKFVDYLMQEGELWLARTRAIEAGALQVRRIQANPP